MGEYSKASIIKYTRKAVGMTQEELAEYSGSVVKTQI